MLRSAPARSAGIATLFALVLALIGFGLSAPGAQAAGGTYQFWGYWQLKGSTWSFAQNGPAKTDPPDGSVEGWRWAVSGTSGGRHPRGTVTFKQVCGDTPEADGKKRVAVVIDYGRLADASKGTPPEPIAKCASVPTKATGSDVLAAVATVRLSKGLVCGIDDWPASGCGGAVQKPTTAQKAPDKTVQIKVAGAHAAPTATSPAPAAAGNPDEGAYSANPQSSSNSEIVLIFIPIVIFVLVIGGVLLALRRRRSIDQD